LARQQLRDIIYQLAFIVYGEFVFRNRFQGAEITGLHTQAAEDTQAEVNRVAVDDKTLDAFFFMAFQRNTSGRANAQTLAAGGTFMAALLVRDHPDATPRARPLGKPLFGVLERYRAPEQVFAGRV